MTKKRVLLTALIAVFIAASCPLFSADQAKKPIGLQDIINWKNIAASEVSPDGGWFIYRLTPVEGDGETVIRQVRGTKEYRVPGGEMRGRFGSAPSFSADSKWAVVPVFPGAKESRDLKRDKKPLRTKAVLVNLATGDRTEFENMRGFAFSRENGSFVLLHKNAPDDQKKGKEPWTGSDLIIRDLASGLETTIGNVSEFALDEKGERLALAIDAQGMTGNGILVRDMKNGRLTPLASGKAVFKQLGWTEKGDALAALKGRKEKDKDKAPRFWSVLGFSGFGGPAAPAAIEYDPAADKSFPEGMTVSPDRMPFWDEPLQAIFFGIHETAKDDEEDKEKKDDNADDIADLIIWHWKDARLQPQQQVEADEDNTFSYLSEYRLAGKKFIRLADDAVRSVDPDRKGRFAVGIDRTPYELDGSLDGRQYQDIYAIDLTTGEKRAAITKCRWFFGTSPDGRYFLYYADKNFHSYDTVTGASVNMTAGIPVSFVDTDDDHNVVDPPQRALGWARDCRRALLSDGWDVWAVPADGKGTAAALTSDGRKDGVRYQRFFRFDRKDYRDGLDLDKPLYIGTYGEWTKKAGVSLLQKGKTGARKLLWDDAVFSTLFKAEKAPVYIYTRETGRDYPDYYAADALLAGAARLTEANPQQKDYLWSSGEMLIDYVSDKGDKLQAALFLPADYQKGKSYPTIVYIYEKLSQNLNRYTTPGYYGFNKSVYTSNGYAVLMPDITYKLNDPGLSAVWCVLPALKAAEAAGVVDPARVGLQGHSWGGYQTAFLVTQTDAFAAAVPGAALTNMISMYSSIYWNSGSSNQPIFESSQARFAGGYWENLEAYARNSPVYHAANVKTPVMLLHNNKDGAVDWNQGIEYFNALRRLKKPVIMLEYVGENHGLSKPANRKDYGVRMREFFDHYLKGAPAPDWYKNGVPYIKLKDYMKESADRLKPAEKTDKADKAKDEKPAEGKKD